jgi:arginine:agmatine antiporter
VKSKSESGSPATGKSLGVSACTAIVIGNMVGSGFYLSPAALAPYGNLAILAWAVMGAGAICVGLTFAKLARLAPATGGPYAYTHGLWRLRRFSHYVGPVDLNLVFPAGHSDRLRRPRPIYFPVFTIARWRSLRLGAIWAVVLVNLRGVKEAGLFSQVTTTRS